MCDIAPPRAYDRGVAHRRLITGAGAHRGSRGIGVRRSGARYYYAHPSPHLPPHPSSPVPLAHGAQWLRKWSLALLYGVGGR